MKMPADRSMADAFMQPDTTHASGCEENPKVLADSLLGRRLGLLIFGADAMSVLQLRNAVLRGVVERNSRMEIVYARPDEDLIVEMSRKLEEASLRGDDLHAAGLEPVKVLVVCGRIENAVAQMRQLLRIAGAFPGLGVRLLVTVDDYPSDSPPPEFDTFGAGLHRHHCPTGTVWSFPLADMHQDESARKAPQALATPDRSPRIEALAKDFTDVAQAESEMPKAIARPRHTKGPAFAGPAPVRRRVFGPKALAGILLLALAMVFLMFPRHAQTLKALLLPTEARLAPALPKDTTNADGAAKGSEPAGERQATALAAEAPLPTPARPDALNAGLTFDDRTPIYLIMAEKLGYPKPDIPTDAAPAISLTEPSTSMAASSLVEAISMVRNAPNSSVFVQLVAMRSADDVQTWLAGQAQLKGALVVPVRTREGNLAFAVVQGPFRTRSSAMEYSKRPEIPAMSWLRSATSLKSALTPPSAPNGAQHGRL